MAKVKKVSDWVHFKMIVTIVSHYYFKLIISKFKVNNTLMFANRNHKNNQNETFENINNQNEILKLNIVK